MLKREELTALVRKAQTMDPDAMNRLFEESRDPIYYFALKTVQNPEAAEDIAQEAMIDIFRNLEKLKDPAAFQAWSREITYRQCLHHMKKTPDLLVSEDEDGYSIFDTLEEENTDFIPDAAMESKDFQKTIHNMVNSLPAEQRAAILLHHFEGLSVKEIAQVQGVSANTVKSRLFYGRKAIKSSVEDYEKKNGIKLHSFAIAPFLAWLFAKEVSATAMPAAAAATTASGIGVAAAASTATTATAATATVAAKASIPLLAKVAAGIAAVGVAVGGVAAAMGLFAGESKGPRYESAYMEIYGESDRFQKSFEAVIGDECAQYIQTDGNEAYHASDPETNLLEGCDVQKILYADNLFGYVDSENTTHLWAADAFRPFPDLKGTVLHGREGLMYNFQVFSWEDGQLYASVYDTKNDVLESINEPVSLHDEYNTYDEIRFHSAFQFLDTQTTYYAVSDGTQIFGSYTTFIGLDHAYCSDFTVDGNPVTVRLLAGDNAGNCHPIFAVEGDDRNLYTFSRYSASAEDIWKLPEGRSIKNLKQVLYAGDLYLLFKDGTVYVKPNHQDEFVKLDHLTKLGKQKHIEKLYLSYEKQEKDLVCLMDDDVLYRYTPEGDENLYRFLGTYNGYYEPHQGKTGLTLTVYRENGEYKATFCFYSLTGMNNSAEGSYTMTVRYDEIDGVYILRGEKWLEKPEDYSFVNLTGTLESDTFSGETPTVFSVIKE